MTYQEFVASKERLAQLEQEYIQAWKEHDIALRKCRKLSASILAVIALADDVIASGLSVSVSA